MRGEGQLLEPFCGPCRTSRRSKWFMRRLSSFVLRMVCKIDSFETGFAFYNIYSAFHRSITIPLHDLAFAVGAQLPTFDFVELYVRNSPRPSVGTGLCS